MSDVVSGRLEATPADLQQPLPAVENDRPVANRETARETSAGLDARLNALLVECGRQEKAIYRGDGVPPTDALPFIGRVARLVEALLGVTSLDTYDDVLESLEDAV